MYAYSSHKCNFVFRPRLCILDSPQGPKLSVGPKP